MSFMVLWSVCLSSSLVHFKNGPEYLTRGDSPGIYPFDEICYIVWFPVVYSFSGDTLFNFFFHLHLFDGVHFQFSLVFLSFLFSKHTDFSWFGSSIPFVMCRFPLLIISKGIFLCRIPSLCPDCIFSLPVWGFPILFYFWKTVYVVHAH